MVAFHNTAKMRGQSQNRSGGGTGGCGWRFISLRFRRCMAGATGISLREFVMNGCDWCRSKALPTMPDWSQTWSGGGLQVEEWSAIHMVALPAVDDRCCWH